MGTQSVKATHDAWSETYDQSIRQIAEVEEIVVKVDDLKKPIKAFARVLRSAVDI